MLTFKASLLASALSVAALAPQPAAAQDTSVTPPAESAKAAANGEITVTAQRREQSLQDTPVAISAYTSTMLQERGVVRLENIAAATPGLQIEPITASPNAIAISMRGALEQNGGTITSESPVAVYIDDVYQSRLSAANYELADIARIEVLRGPQGTLYGRNSMTGAIKLITRQPNGQTWFNSDVSVGSFEEVKAKASIGAPIGGHLAVAASGFYDVRNRGWQYNEVLRTDVSKFQKYGGQLAIGLVDVPNVEAVLTGRYSASLTDGLHLVPLNLATGGSASGGFSNTRTPRDADGDVRQKSVSLKLGYDFGDVTVRSISAYQKLDDLWALDFSGGYDSPFTGSTIAGFFRTADGDQKQFTQELQALGKAFDGKLNWIVGAFYYNESAHQAFINDDLAAFFLSFRPTDFRTRSKSLAIYGQADYKFFDSLTVSVGLRHTNDKKTFNGLSPNAPGPSAALVSSITKADANVWTPRFNIQYDINPDAMIYATVSKGYRAGGFNSLVIADPANFGSPYKPEQSWSYEFGTKLQTTDHQAHLNLAAYYEDLTNLQTLADFGSGSFIIQNAAAARVWGVEVEAGVNPVAGLALYLSGAYTGDEYGKLDPGSQAAQAGAKRLPLVSRFQYQVGGSYELQLGSLGSVVLAADYSYRGPYYNQIALLPNSLNKSIGRSNASITYKAEGDHLELYVQARNVTNSKDYYGGFEFIPGVFGNKGPLEPRVIMGGFRYKM